MAYLRRFQFQSQYLKSNEKVLKLKHQNTEIN